MDSFEGKSIWITGASAGLGRELALAFAREGAHLTLSARREERLVEVAEEVNAAGGSAAVRPLDVTDEAATSHVVAELVEREGGLDVAVANAGFGVTGPFEKLDAAAWRRQFEVNVIGLVITARAALPHLHERRGRLALLGSVAGMLPGPRTSPYSASKAAVRSIGQSLTIELHGTGTTCTTICPGFVESEIGRVDNSGSFDATREDGRPTKLLWPADRAARVMLRAIRARRREFTFTAHGRLAGFLGRHAPGLVHQLARRFG
jgi:short-subunit dehydrogenase